MKNLLILFIVLLCVMTNVYAMDDPTPLHSPVGEGGSSYHSFDSPPSHYSNSEESSDGEEGDD